MVDLENSKRALPKATYVPLRTQSNTSSSGSNESPQPKTGRALEKIAYVRSLNIQPQEFDALKAREVVARLRVPSVNTSITTRIADAGTSQNVSLLDLVQQIATNPSPVAMERFGPLLATVSAEDLATLGYALTDIRRETANTVATKIQEIEHHYQQALNSSSQVSREITPSALTSPAPAHTDAVSWAMARNLPAFRDLYSTALTHTPNLLVLAPMRPAMVINQVVNDLIRNYTGTAANTDSFIARQRIEPVGWLHLERMEMTPVGIEHGELLHSVPLTPKETVNITHREWSIASKTFEDIVQDSLEGFSETGVTEKNDLSQATETQNKHTSALDVSGNVSASYNGGAYSVSASASADYHATSEDFHSVKISQTHAQAITRTASERTKKDHKVSFRVSSVAGAEDLSVRVLTNPSETNAMRVDYFQLLRKWRVDLIRYGVRMTYDFVIPNPGADLMRQYDDLRLLDAQIAVPFTFPFPISQVDRSSWIDLSTQYGTLIDPPQEENIKLQLEDTLGDQGDTYAFKSLDFDVPPEYEIAGGILNVALDTKQHSAFGIYGAGPEHSDSVFTAKLDFLVGRSGRVSVIYSYKDINAGHVDGILDLKLKDEIFQQWQLKAWNTLRQAALDAYTHNLQSLQEQRAKLAAAIGIEDPLSLRKMEREAIMKGVLLWLFGPTFEQELISIANTYLVPNPTPTTFDPTDPYHLKFFQTLGETGWSTVLRYGEFIKFIHNAIEWENVIYFTYPYFWDNAKNWPFKQFLMHPDLEHREFLRAGGARIVITIRPGFEHDFSALVELGKPFAPLPNDHPYVSISDEIHNFAMTNYEGVPPANPDHNVRLLLYPEQQKAWKDMQVIIRLLEQYSDANQPAVTLDPAFPDPSLQDPNAKAKVKVYPTTAQGLDALKDLAKQDGIPWPLKDPWGRVYHYTSPGLHGDYDLICYGANGVPGGTDLDADITSWAEGSVVARWYEYTPTSAMDVSINTVLPTSPQPA
jgi:hypothetical protein